MQNPCQIVVSPCISQKHREKPAFSGLGDESLTVFVEFVTWKPDTGISIECWRHDLAGRKDRRTQCAPSCSMMRETVSNAVCVKYSISGAR